MSSDKGVMFVIFFITFSVYDFKSYIPLIMNMK